MNRREFVRAALLAGAGAACGVRAASPAPARLEFEGLRFRAMKFGTPILVSREVQADADVLGPLLDEMRQNMCDALDEEWISGRWPSIAGG